ncbi:CU044_5270 family protein [Actinomadura violacea]|uniref:CU044_5270 family protein n=1 Tax=Actinomadura violacea TaxID=2819934 RepID=A0ABS3RMF5_9ACTN|nr:CU044_5270 family protein [Actinomadura violacea]MBO2457508.1 CU044_5270 family protein [Actinomadura violacea]
MSSGEKRTMKDVDTTFRALRPAALDELAGEAHERRRDAEVERIMRTSAEPRTVPRAVTRPGRRPLLLAAGVAAAAVVAGGGAVAVTGGGDGPARRHTPVTQPSPVDARTFLLASAKAAERAPVKPGRYWYERIQTRVVHEYEHDLPGHTLPRPSPGSRKGRPKLERLPYTFVTTGRQESWTARSAHDRTRTITGIGVRASFPTPRDQAQWRRAGAPELLSKEDRTRSVNTYDMPVRYQIGNAQVSMDELRRLPVDAAVLGRELRRRYEADMRKSGGAANVDPYPYYIWMTAQDLLAGPITPGTKAALYRVLAGQQGIRSDGPVADPVGRRGVAVSMGGLGGRIRLVIDPKTAELLAYESFVGADGVPGLSETYEQTGWVDALDERP